MSGCEFCGSLVIKPRRKYCSEKCKILFHSKKQCLYTKNKYNSYKNLSNTEKFSELARYIEDNFGIDIK